MAAEARNPLRLAGAALALTLAVLTVPVRVSASDALAVAPTPGIVAQPLPIPPIPIGKKLTAFSKDARGETAQAQVLTTQCSGQLVEEISNLPVKVLLRPGPCDEGFSKDVLNGTLLCSVNITRRKIDLRGCFSGRWTLLSASGAALAQGAMNGTVGCGTHRSPGTPPCEECHEPKHYEGFMTGQVLIGPYKGAEICATLAGTGPLQPSTPQQMSIEGVVISNCIQ
jgi:hypothetical protein